MAERTVNESRNVPRPENIALARPNCAYCGGSGIHPNRRVGMKKHPCSCVYRAVFKTCFMRFRECVSVGKYISTVNIDWSSGPIGKRFYGRKIEEYMADFCLVSRRELSEDLYRLFRYHYVLAADWKLCCAALKMDKGEFFHRVYKIETTLGRVFYHMKPYPLFPLYEYFGPASEATFGNGSGMKRRTVKRQARVYELKKIA